MTTFLFSSPSTSASHLARSRFRLPLFRQTTANLMAQNAATPHRSRQPGNRTSAQPHSPANVATPGIAPNRQNSRRAGPPKLGIDPNAQAAAARGQAPSPLMVNPPGTARRVSGMSPGASSPMHPYATAATVGTTGGMHVPSMQAGTPYGVHSRGVTQDDSAYGGRGTLGTGPGAYGARSPINVGGGALNAHGGVHHAGGIGANAGGEQHKEKKGFLAVLCCR